MSIRRDMERRKLKNFVVNPQFQIRYVFWVVVSGLVMVLFNASIFYHFTRENYLLLVDMAPMSAEARAHLFRELNDVLLRLGGFSFLFLGIVAMLGVVLSHRAAGPLYHFKRVFADIRAGKRDTRVFLRPYDDFRDVADEFNGMMDSLVGEAKHDKTSSGN